MAVDGSFYHAHSFISLFSHVRTDASKLAVLQIRQWTNGTSAATTTQVEQVTNAQTVFGSRFRVS
jgi:hypothetical protein